MDFAGLPLDIILLVAEQLDIVSLVRLMLTNREIHALLLNHERSICIVKLPAFTLQPSGNVLTSTGIERQICAPLTFHCLHELEVREARADAILASGYIDVSRLPCQRPLTPDQQDHYAAIMRRSLLQCDAIADIAANVPGGPVPEYNYTLISGGYWNLADGSLPAEIRRLNPFTNIHARPAQIEHLMSLPKDVLAGLYLTVITMSAGHVQTRPSLREDPNFAERITVFEECILRHGTWFLGAQIVSNSTEGSQESSNGESRSSLRELTDHMLLAGFAELIGWETGVEDVPPGLRMSVLDAAKHHFEDRQRPIVAHLYDAVGAIISSHNSHEHAVEADEIDEGDADIEDVHEQHEN